MHQGIVVWINTSLEQLVIRLKEDQHSRPLLEKKSLVDSLDFLMKERESFYSQSDLDIYIEAETPQQVAMLIKKKLLNTVLDPISQDEQQTTAT